MLNPKPIISHNFDRLTGRDAWMTNLRLASLVANVVRSNLGPKGQNKLIVYNRGPEQVVKITKDVVAIAEELSIQYPAIKIISEAAKMHRDEIGDGVASFVIILSDLLKKAEELLSKGVHANLVIQGYSLAARESLRIIDEFSMKIEDNSFREVLEVVDCCRGFLSYSVDQMLIEATELARKNGKVDKKMIRIMKKLGGRTNESELIHGVVIKKEKVHPSMPDLVEKPRIALLNTRIGIKHLEVKMKGEGVFPISLDIHDSLQIKAFKSEEIRLMMQLAEKISSTGANVVITSQLINNNIMGAFARRDIFALMGVECEDLDAVSQATGAKIIGDINDLSQADLGYADRLEVGKIEPEKTVTLNGCGGITLLLRGSTPQILEEFEKTIRNAILVLKGLIEDEKVIPGGGAMEMYISKELEHFSLKFPGKEQLAIRSFAEALKEIPRSLAQNFGLDPLDTLIQLNQYHTNGLHMFGVSKEGPSDMIRLRVKESALAKSSVIRRAYEVAKLLLKVDDMIYATEIAKVHTQ